GRDSSTVISIIFTMNTAAATAVTTRPSESMMNVFDIPNMRLPIMKITSEAIMTGFGLNFSVAFTSSGPKTAKLTAYTVISCPVMAWDMPMSSLINSRIPDMISSIMPSRNTPTVNVINSFLFIFNSISKIIYYAAEHKDAWAESPIHDRICMRLQNERIDPHTSGGVSYCRLPGSGLGGIRCDVQRIREESERN